MVVSRYECQAVLARRLKTWRAHVAGKVRLCESQAVLAAPRVTAEAGRELLLTSTGSAARRSSRTSATTLKRKSAHTLFLQHAACMHQL